jgi:hypothetical protein
MKKKIFYFILFSFVLGFLSLTTSCGKINSLSKKHLSFSVDTLVFDTVFTTIGSTTQQFKIYNNDNKSVIIEEIELMGGSNSFFRMNVDGIALDMIKDTKLLGRDSLFAFVEVTLNTNGQTLPLIIEDSIRFRTNGVDQYIKLAVWGQDAYFHYKDLNEGIWPNDKPHVIYGYAAVDSSKTLTIPAGTQIHLHKNALLYVYKSSLHVEGTLGNEVVFKGDRLEQMYQDVEGQYYGIYFHEAKESTIDYAIIKNGTSGIHVYSNDASNPNYTLTLTNSKIFNHSRYGIFIYSGGKVKAENCIVSKCGTHALIILEGGDVNFNHCNLLGYGNSQSPAVGISNFYNDYTNGVTNVGSINEGKFYNCIISGNLNSELAIDTIQMSGVSLNFDFKNCLIRSEIIFQDTFYQNTLWNDNPLFEDTAQGDFLFTSNSTLNGNGLVSSVTNDILGSPRNNPPDIGAIELN